MVHTSYPKRSDIVLYHDALEEMAALKNPEVAAKIRIIMESGDGDMSVKEVSVDSLAA